jgi:hypothetical protein
MHTHDLSFVCQIITLIVWGLAVFNVQFPSPGTPPRQRTPWNLWILGWWFLLLSFMIGGFNVALHPITGLIYWLRSAVA